MNEAHWNECDAKKEIYSDTRYASYDRGGRRMLERPIETDTSIAGR